jgi:hypothetical protein
MEKLEKKLHQKPEDWRGMIGLAISALLLIMVLFVPTVMSDKDQIRKVDSPITGSQISLIDQVVSPTGVVLPIDWQSLGERMVAAGVIDSEKFQAVYEQRGGLSDTDMELLFGDRDGSVVMNSENAGILLNLLWAFGLSNKNEILEEDPMMAEGQNRASVGRLASTGGWRLSKQDPMNHYSRHSFVSLTTQQQERVEDVSKNIYRPCCGNSTHFPDCNHGMAMLGLLQLLAKEGVGEAEMYDVALAVNSYWFPETYTNIAALFAQNLIPWEEVNPKVVLGARFSSAQGYQQVLNELDSADSGNGSGCSV